MVMPKLKIEEDYKPAYDAWVADPSKENTGAMLKTLDPVLTTAMRAYGGPAASSVTLRGQAKQLAVEALGSYNPRLGPLRPHMMSRLQRLRRVAAQQRQIIRMPEQVALDQMRTDAAAKELEDQLGREPSDQELADYTGLSLRRLAHIRAGVRPTAMSTITRMTEGDTGGYEPGVTSLDEDYSVWLELVYSDLDPTNQFIMERMLGLHGAKKLRPGEIAAKLKISPAAVSHRLSHIQQKIDQRETLQML